MESPKLTPIDNFGDHLTLNEFINLCYLGVVTDYDGIGKYATANYETDILVSPSEINRGEINRNWSHVMWYNK